MSFKFFQAVLQSLGKKLNYEAISNLAGNSFAKDAWKLISEANPLSNPGEKKHTSEFMNILNTITVKTPEQIKAEQESAAAAWATGLFG